MEIVQGRAEVIIISFSAKEEKSAYKKLKAMVSSIQMKDMSHIRIRNMTWYYVRPIGYIITSCLQIHRNKKSIQGVVILVHLSMKERSFSIVRGGLGIHFHQKYMIIGLIAQQLTKL